MNGRLLALSFVGSSLTWQQQPGTSVLYPPSATVVRVRLWHHHRTVSCVWQESSTRYSHRTQNAAWRSNQSLSAPIASDRREQHRREVWAKILYLVSYIGSVVWSHCTWVSDAPLSATTVLVCSNVIARAQHQAKLQEICKLGFTI